MEGIPASRSIIEPKMFAIFVLRKYSPINNETEKAIGIHKINANIDVINVPAINDKAPYFSWPSVGFHSEEKINPAPNSLNAGIEPFTRENPMPAEISSINNVEPNNTDFVIFSPFISIDGNGAARFFGR